MKRTLSVVGGLVFCLSAFDANAIEEDYACDRMMSNTDRLVVNAIVTIPDSASAGTIVWRMPERAMSYNCWRGDNDFSTYYFFNPENKSFGSDIEVGVTLDGVDYRPSSTKKHAHNFYSKLCGVAQLCRNDIKNYRVSVFIVKKSNSGSTSKTKSIDINNYVPYQIGKDYSVGRSRLSVQVSGLEANLLPCTSTVIISPNTIDFGEISSTGATPELEIQRGNFTLSEQRACQSTSTYGLNGILHPAANANLYDSMGTLVPKDNDSVGISIFDGESNTPVRFGSEFVVIPKVGTINNSKQFEVRLKWRTKSPKVGGFNAGAVLDVYYK
jgi:hypothetical protein